MRDQKYIDGIVVSFRNMLCESDGSVQISRFREERNRHLAKYAKAYGRLLTDADFEWLKDEYGVTKDYKSAGWILPDGTALNLNRTDPDRIRLHTDMCFPPDVMKIFGQALSSYSIGSEDLMLESGCTRIGNMTPDLTDGEKAYMIQQTLKPTRKQKDSLMDLSDTDMSEYDRGELSFQAFGRTFRYSSGYAFNRFFYGNVLNAQYAESLV